MRNVWSSRIDTLFAGGRESIGTAAWPAPARLRVPASPAARRPAPWRGWRHRSGPLSGRKTRWSRGSTSSLHPLRGWRNPERGKIGGISFVNFLMPHSRRRGDASLLLRQGHGAPSSTIRTPPAGTTSATSEPGAWERHDERLVGEEPIGGRRHGGPRPDDNRPVLAGSVGVIPCCDLDWPAGLSNVTTHPARVRLTIHSTSPRTSTGISPRVRWREEPGQDGDRLLINPEPARHREDDQPAPAPVERRAEDPPPGAARQRPSTGDRSVSESLRRVGRLARLPGVRRRLGACPHCGEFQRLRAGAREVAVGHEQGAPARTYCRQPLSLGASQRDVARGDDDRIRIDRRPLSRRRDKRRRRRRYRRRRRGRRLRWSRRWLRSPWVRSGGRPSRSSRGASARGHRSGSGWGRPRSRRTRGAGTERDPSRERSRAGRPRG